MKKISPLNGKRILVVDDEEQLRKCIVFDFEKRGCVVFEAANGKEGLKIVVAENPIHAVISDVRMPNGSGVELLEGIRKIHPDIPVVLLVTGFNDMGESEALKKGAVGIMEKPIDRKKMLDLVIKSIEKTFKSDV